MEICKIIKGFLLVIVSLLVITGLTLHLLYKPITEGTFYLEKAYGDAEVLREVDTSIPHVYANSELMAVYT
jgi:hypothetical protein